MCDDGCTIKSRCFAYVCPSIRPSVRHLKNLNIQCEGRSLAGEVETDGNNALPIDDRTIAVTILCVCDHEEHGKKFHIKCNCWLSMTDRSTTMTWKEGVVAFVVIVVSSWDSKRGLDV